MPKRITLIHATPVSIQPIESAFAKILTALTDVPVVDVVILAQFSMVRAQAKVAAQVPVPVLTTPDTAVQKLKLLVPAS